MFHLADIFPWLRPDAELPKPPGPETPVVECDRCGEEFPDDGWDLCDECAKEIVEEIAGGRSDDETETR